MRGNFFLVCSACDEIGSAYAQHAMKKMTKKSLIKMQISPIKNQNFEKPPRSLSDRTKVKILKEKNFFLISLKKNLVLRMLSHRGNVQTSKQWWANLDQTPNDLDKTIFRNLSPTPIP